MLIIEFSPSVQVGIELRRRQSAVKPCLHDNYRRGEWSREPLSEMWLHFQSLPSRPLFDPINRYMHPHLGPFYAPRRAAYQRVVIAVLLTASRRTLFSVQKAYVSDHGAFNYLYGQLREDRDKFLISFVWRYLNFPSYF